MPQEKPKPKVPVITERGDTIDLATILSRYAELDQLREQSKMNTKSGSFFRDTLQALANDLIGRPVNVEDTWLGGGTAGSVSPTNPDQINLDLNAIYKEATRPAQFRERSNYTKGTAAHELWHTRQFDRLNKGTLNAAEGRLAELHAYIAETLVRSLQDHLSTEPNKVDIQNIIDRGMSRFLQSYWMQANTIKPNDPEFSMRVYQDAAPYVLEELLNTETYKNHPVNR